MRHKSPKNRKKQTLILTTVIAIALYVAAFIFFFASDEYAFGWISAFAQTLLVFVFFKSEEIQARLKAKIISERSIKHFLFTGAMITAISVHFKCIVAVVATQIGSAMVLLGLNALVTYLDFAFSEADEKERKKRKCERKKAGRHKKAKNQKVKKQ